MQQIYDKLNRALYPKEKKNQEEELVPIYLFLFSQNLSEMHRFDLHFCLRNSQRVDKVSLLPISYKNLHRKSISIRKKTIFSDQTFVSSSLQLVIRLHFSDTDRISLYEASQWGSKQTHVCNATVIYGHWRWCALWQHWTRLRASKNQKKNSTLNSLAITISTPMRNKAKTAMFKSTRSTPASPRKICLPLSCVGLVCRCDVERYCRHRNRMHVAVTRFDIVVHWHCYASIQSSQVRSRVLCVCTWWISLSFSIFLLFLFCFYAAVALRTQDIFFHWKRETARRRRNEATHRIRIFFFTSAVRLALVVERMRWKMSVNSIKRTFESSIRIVEQWDKIPIYLQTGSH